MLLKEKINLPRYLFLSTLLVVGFILGFNISGVFLFWFSTAFVAIVLNHLLLTVLVYYLFKEDRAAGGKKFDLFLIIILKMSVLLLAFYLCVQYIGDKILFVVALYIFQLIILSFSMKIATD